jgi:hypothetical protein
MTIATTSDIAAALGRDLTDAETSQAQRRIDSAVDILEGLLNRTLELGAFVETRTPEPAGSLPSQQATGWSTIGYTFGVVHLAHRPVQTLTSVTCQGVDITASVMRDHDTVYLPTLAPVELSYTAGDDPTAPQVRDAIINAVARYYFVPPAAAAGVNVSYSVEGTSINYTSYRTMNDPRVGPFTGEEIRGLKASLRRFVMR